MATDECAATEHVKTVLVATKDGGQTTAKYGYNPDYFMISLIHKDLLFLMTSREQPSGHQNSMAEQSSETVSKIILEDSQSTRISQNTIQPSRLGKNRER